MAAEPRGVIVHSPTAARNEIMHRWIVVTLFALATVAFSTGEAWSQKGKGGGGGGKGGGGKGGAVKGGAVKGGAVKGGPKVGKSGLTVVRIRPGVRPGARARWRRGRVIVAGGVAPGVVEPAPGTVEPAVGGGTAQGMYGVQITALSAGTAMKQGLKVGDVILSYDGKETPTFEALAAAVQESGKKAEVVFLNPDTGDQEALTLFPVNGRIGVTVEPVELENS
jgi:hypothetical protein